MEPKPQETIWEKFETAQFATGFLAMAVVPAFRQRVGLRMVRGIYLWPAVLLMAAYGYQTPGHPLFMYYAALVGLAGLWQHRQRWAELKRGDLTHTRSLGVSPVHLLFRWPKFPAQWAEWLTHEQRVTRYVDPLIILGIGALLFRMDQTFGGFVIVCAAALRVFEEYNYQRSWDKILDELDAMLAGEGFTAILQSLRGKVPQAEGAINRQTESAADELRDIIAQRRREHEAREAQKQREAEAKRKEAQQPEEKRNPVAAAASQVKAAAEAVKDAAGAVRAVREATGPATRETIILGVSETREVVRERAAVYIVPEPPPALNGAAQPAMEATPPGAALASGAQRAELTEPQPPARPALSAPQDNTGKTL